MTVDMSGATLQTLRESLHITREDLAAAVGVQARTIKHWEHARARVPDDVADTVRSWCAHTAMITAAALAKAEAAAAAGAPLVLARYRYAGDLLTCRPDWPEELPVACHGAAIARVLNQHPGAEIRWYEPENSDASAIP